MQTTFPGSKIVLGSEFSSSLLDREAIFPPYFTVWFVDPDRERVEDPTFLTYYAAETYGAAPLSQETLKPLPDWSLIEAWMRENGIYGGVSHAIYRLIIERIE